MKRYITLFISLLAMVLTAPANAETKKIIILETMPVKVVTDHTNAIQSALRGLEKRRGWQFDIEVLSADGDKTRAIELLRQSVAARRPDLVLPVATLAAQAAKEVLPDMRIPVIFSVVTDPVGAGIVSNIDVPSGNFISGIVFPQHNNTRIETVMRVLNLSADDTKVTFGIIGSDYPSSISDLRTYEQLAKTLPNIEFVSHSYNYKPVPSGLPEMYKNMLSGVEKIRDQVDFFWERGGPMAQIPKATQILINSGKPVIFGFTERSVRQGALMGVATDYADTGMQVANMTEKVFEGTDVGTLPVTVPRRFKLFINMKTAKKYGIKIPSHILMIAGENAIY
ncbi:MAG: ABC transporter substrate binding protein [Pseudomonas marincola]